MEKTREDFCGICVAAPLIVSSMGLSQVASGDEYKKAKRIKLGVGIASLVVILVIYIVYKDCDACQ